jgi:hypothetical protein
MALSINRAGTNVSLNWSGGSPPYVLQIAGALSASSNAWTTLLITNRQSATLPMITTNVFFGVQGQ